MTGNETQSRFLPFLQGPKEDETETEAKPKLNDQRGSATLLLSDGVYTWALA